MFRGILAAALCLIAAALTLLLPSVPSYDPWSWLVWGREVIGLDLRTTTGPSWKPLPVLLTAPYSLAGPIAPDLWLVTARAATFGAVATAVVLGTRLGGRAAGVLSGGLLLFSPWLWGATWTGNSEGILILCVLAAAHRHLAGRQGQAFGLAVAAGLLRPEAWPFLGLYAIWLLVEDRRRLAWLAGGLAVIPALWLLPELWGSGSLFRAAERAQQPGVDAPAMAPHPAFTVTKNAVKLAPLPVLLGLVAWMGGVLRRRSQVAKILPSLALGGLAGAWVLLVAVMSEFGFSGISRYLFAPVGIACVLAGVGLGWAFSDLVKLRTPRFARRAAALLIVAGALVGAAPHFDGDSPTVNQLKHEAAVIGELETVVAQAGGERALEACGPLYASYQTTPSIAWTLDRHLEDVSPYARPPGTVMRARLLLADPIDPPPNAFAGALRRHDVARTTHWSVEAACRVR